MTHHPPTDLSSRSVPRLRAALDALRTDRLDRAAAAAFEKRIRAYCAGEVEPAHRIPAPDAENQRPQAMSFRWGHDHDFGSFQVAGAMGTRHLWLLARLFDHFDVPASAVEGESILDVGCWTGGVSLVLSGLGGQVVAIDEVPMYVDALSYVVETFRVEGLESRCLSLYDLERAGYSERFGTVFCLGVLYHLTDPVVGLRRLYNAMRPGGLLCLESKSFASDESLCRYEGPTRREGEAGWNWLVPSPPAIRDLLRDTGFDEIRVGDGLADLAVTGDDDPLGPGRCFAVARKRAGHVLTRAGLSTTIR